MKNDPIRTKVLSIRLIPNADRFLLKAMQVQEGHRSLGLITTDCDDVSYAALDEATKKADVSVAYARSMYAGSSNASTALAGEFIGILSGENPEDVKSGLAAAVSYIENDACFYSANNDDSIVYFAQCISRTGSYLSEMAGVPGRNGNGLSDRTAVGSGDGTGCGVESGRCGNEPVLWAAYRDQLCRRAADR